MERVLPQTRRILFDLQFFAACLAQERVILVTRLLTDQMNDLEFFLAFCHRRFSRSLAAARNAGPTHWFRQGPKDSRSVAAPLPGAAKNGDLWLAAA